MNMYFGILIIGVTVAACSQILLKIGANRPHVSLIRDYLNVPVISGYVLMALSVVCSMIAFRGLDYMSVPLMDALGFVLVPILSRVCFKEGFTAKKIAGIALIVAGMVVYYI